MLRTSDAPELDEHERKAVRDVEEHGLHIIDVLPEGGTPGWAYSIGLWRNFQHPEVVVFGLNQNVAHHLLNHVADELRAGRRFEVDGNYGDMLEGVRCTMRPVARHWHYPLFGWADWFYDGEAYTVLQCIWPDHDQHWPWETEFRQDWLWVQPLLWHADARAARMGDLLASMDLEHGPSPAEPDAAGDVRPGT